jgi:DNA-binding SARP family transcriptional activator/tetratricopeptide (TPR) repeat protein
MARIPKQLQIKTLGGINVFQDGMCVAFRSRFDTAVLLLLAWYGVRGVSRDRLSNLLWDQARPSESRHSLSQVLYRLRRRLPYLDLHSAGDWISVAGPIELDCRELLNAVSQQRWADAVAIYTGPFLLGFNTSISVAFEEWCDDINRQIITAATRALSEYFAIVRRVGDLHNASLAIDTLVKIDPHNRVFQEEQALVLAALGNCGQAMQLLRNFPKSVRQRLAGAINNVDPERTKAYWGRGVPNGRFVGRRTEFQFLNDLWSETKRGFGATVLVYGEAGIGKSRLCDHFLRSVAVRGGRVLVGACSVATQGVPFSAWVNILRSENRLGPLQVSRDRILAVLDDLPRTDPSDFLATRMGPNVHEQLAEFFCRLAQERPTAIWLDDMHWSDESSLSQLQHLADRAASQPLLIIASCRLEELTSGARSVLDAIASSSPSCRVTALGCLSKADVWLLYDSFEKASGQVVPAHLKELLYQRVSGRPLFLLEILRELDSKREDREDDVRKILASDHIPDRIAILLSNRVRSLSSIARSILQAVAGIGIPAPIEVVGPIAGCDAMQSLDAIDELLSSKLVVETPAGLAPAHDFVRVAVLGTLGRNRRAALHAAVGNALQAAGNAPAAVLAEHFDAAHAQPQAFRYLCQASEESLRLNAFREADHYLDRAAQKASSENDRNQVLSLRVDLLFRTKRFREAHLTCKALRDWLEHRRDDRGIARCDTVELLASLADGNKPVEVLLNEALQLVDEAACGSELDLAERLCSVCDLAYDNGEHEFLEAFLPKMHSIGQAMREDWPAAVVLAVCATTYAVSIDAVAAKDIANAGLSRAEKAESVPATVRAHFACGNASLAAGRLEEARSSLEAAIHLAGHANLHVLAGLCINNYAVTLFEQGLVRDAIHLLEKDVTELSPHARLFRLANLILFYLDLGQFENAGVTSTRLQIENRRFKAQWAEATAALVEGTAALRGGDLGLAAEHAKVVASVLQGRASVGDPSYFSVFVSRVSALMGDMDGARERLEHTILATQRTQVLGCLRARVALVELIESADLRRSRLELLDLRDEAARLGANLILRQIDRSLLVRRLAIH